MRVLEKVFSKKMFLDPENYSIRFREIEELSCLGFVRRKIIRDILKKESLLAIEYSSLQWDDLIEIKQQFAEIYNQEVMVGFEGFLEQYDDKYGYSTLILHFQHYPTLQQFLLDEPNQSYYLCNLRHTAFIFRSIVRALDYLKGWNEYIGNISEKNIFIDEQNAIRILWHPRMHSQDSHCVASMRYSKGQSLKHSMILLSPEILSSIREEEKSFSFYIDMHRNDIFCLALMCVRLLGPETFYQAYDLENLDIDLQRLDYLLTTIGVFVSSDFSGLLRSCLEYSPKLRPETELILEEMGEYGIEEISEGLYSMEKMSEWEYQVLREDVFINQQNSRSQSKTSQNEFIGIAHKPTEAQPFYLSVRTPKKLNNISEILSSNSKKVNHRKVCLNFLEKQVFNVFHGSQKNKMIGNTRFRYKTYSDKYKFGFLDQGEIYFGFMRKNQKSRKGVTFLQNGEVYYGQYKRGREEGIGIRFLVNGDIIQGEFKKGRLDGQACLYESKSGYSYDCMYEKDNLIIKGDDGICQKFRDLDIDYFYRDFIPGSNLVRTLLKQRNLNDEESIYCTDFRASLTENNTPITATLSKEYSNKKLSTTLATDIPKTAQKLDFGSEPLFLKKSPLQLLVSKHTNNRYFIEDDSEMDKLKTQYLDTLSPRNQENIVDYKNLRNVQNSVLVYEGGYKNGKFDGFGTIHFKGNQRLECWFIDGIPDGKGTFYQGNGRRVIGSWDKGIFEYEYSAKEDMDYHLVESNN